MSLPSSRLAASARDSDRQVALDHVDFDVKPGRIVGLIGPNGAGKTTALRAVLGLTSYDGQLEVLGREPFRERAQLMEEASFIADVAVLPSWLAVDHAIEFVGGVHPTVSPRARARTLLAEAQASWAAAACGELSKGMKTMVHLALTMAIDARLLVLDEPTLGLDILARRGFYDALVNDYMDETRTILITTHQVEEVENLLTDVLFIDKGRIVLDCSMEDIATRYAAIDRRRRRHSPPRAPNGLSTSVRVLGKRILYFEQPNFERLAALGKCRHRASPTCSSPSCPGGCPHEHLRVAGEAGILGEPGHLDHPGRHRRAAHSRLAVRTDGRHGLRCRRRGRARSWG